MDYDRPLAEILRSRARDLGGSGRSSPYHMELKEQLKKRATHAAGNRGALREWADATAAERSEIVYREVSGAELNAAAKAPKRDREDRDRGGRGGFSR